MSHFDWFVASTALLSFVVLLSWLYQELKHKLRYVEAGEQKPYQEVAKTMVTAAGIALAIVASGKGVIPQDGGHELRIAIVALVISLLFSILFMLTQVRAYESAQANSPHGDQGRLSILGHILIYVFAWPALTGFLVGFLYLAKAAYSLHESQR